LARFSWGGLDCDSIPAKSLFSHFQLAVFLYPVAQMAIPDGTVLEGHGVVRDIEVGLDREMLLKGIDSQLDSAVRSIEEETY
jgi:C-terminal processing protease CtpA/Prc